MPRNFHPDINVEKLVARDTNIVAHHIDMLVWYPSDLMSVIWLQGYLASFSPTAPLVVVAPDREFIDTVVQEVITLRYHTPTYFTGNLSSCERLAHKQSRATIDMKDAMDRQKEAARTIQSEVTAVAYGLIFLGQCASKLVFPNQSISIPRRQTTRS